MKRLNCIIIFFGLISNCYGQKDSIEINGLTLSLNGNRPLKNVEIIIEIHGKPSLRQMTKEDGKYYFKIKKSPSIAILYSQTNKFTSDGIKTGDFLQCKDSPKIDLSKENNFKYEFYYKEVIH